MNFTAETPKQAVFSSLRKELEAKKLRIEKCDDNRPWGGFFVIEESQADFFIKTYFPQLQVSDFNSFSKLSPKVLVVAPEKRLSWQYHFRRSEIWKVVGGAAGVIISDTDEQGPMQILPEQAIISIEKEQRHRLIGLQNSWGIIAEIWKHTDAANPSDEQDIVRLEDDFGR